MEKEKEPNILESLFERASDYVETNVELLKLKAIDKSSEVISSIVSAVVVLLVVLIFVILINIGLALWIGDMLGKVYYGFFIMAGVYIIAGFIFHLSKDRILKKPLVDIIIKKLLN
jgi:hypothetical protein